MNNPAPGKLPGQGFFTYPGLTEDEFGFGAFQHDPGNAIKPPPPIPAAPGNPGSIPIPPDIAIPRPPIFGPGSTSSKEISSLI